MSKRKSDGVDNDWIVVSFLVAGGAEMLCIMLIVKAPKTHSNVPKILILLYLLFTLTLSNLQNIRITNSLPKELNMFLIFALVRVIALYFSNKICSLCQTFYWYIYVEKMLFFFSFTLNPSQGKGVLIIRNSVGKYVKSHQRLLQ